jgi:hypothetical protein
MATSTVGEFGAAAARRAKIIEDDDLCVVVSIDDDEDDEDDSDEFVPTKQLAELIDFTQVERELEHDMGG